MTFSFEVNEKQETPMLNLLLGVTGIEETFHGIENSGEDIHRLIIFSYTPDRKENLIFKGKTHTRCFSLCEIEKHLSLIKGEPNAKIIYSELCTFDIENLKNIDLDLFEYEFKGKVKNYLDVSLGFFDKKSEKSENKVSRIIGIELDDLKKIKQKIIDIYERNKNNLTKLEIKEFIEKELKDSNIRTGIPSYMDENFELIFLQEKEQNENLNEISNH